MTVQQSQIQLRECTVRILDGRLASLSPVSAPANSRLTFTDAVAHRGSLVTLLPTKVAIIVAGMNTALSVTVSGRNITINQSTDGGGAATGTANQIITAYNLVGAAVALATIAKFTGSTGAGITAAAAQAALGTGARSLEMKLGDGDASWEEMSDREYHNDRDQLDSVRDGDEQPVPLSLDGVYEFLTAVAMSGNPTVQDAINQEGEADDWVTSDPNTCNIYCVDVEIERDLPCTPAKKELTMFPMFRWEDEDCDPKTSNLKFSGHCNVTRAQVTQLD